MQSGGLNGETLHDYASPMINVDPGLQLGWFIHPDTLMKLPSRKK